MNSSAAPTVPAPSFDYQGAFFSLLAVDLRLGPFSLSSHPGLGLGHTVGQTQDGKVPVTTIRCAPPVAQDADPSGTYIQMGYVQNDPAWEMAFSVLTDPKGGLINSSFALEVASNYSDLPMSIDKTLINQPGLSVLTHAKLPGDYRAQLTLRFWQEDASVALPLDAWLSVQIAYYKTGGGPGRTEVRGIPLVTTHELVFHPAYGQEGSQVLGTNYPVAGRHLR